MPSSKTLSNLSPNLDCPVGLQSKSYFRTRVQSLFDFERHVVLIIDEVYVAKRVEMSGGQILGLDANDESCSIILCFMVSSVCGSYQDDVLIYPMNGLTSTTLLRSKKMPSLEIILVTMVTLCFCLSFAVPSTFIAKNMMRDINDNVKKKSSMKVGKFN